MIRSYQEERELKREPSEKTNFATVTGVYDDGLTLLIDGATEPTKKRYKRNKSATFEVGDRVKIFRDSGSIIVEYPIG